MNHSVLPDYEQEQLAPSFRRLPTTYIKGISPPKLRDIAVLQIEPSEKDWRFYVDGIQLPPSDVFRKAVGRSMYAACKSTGEIDALFAHLPPDNTAQLFQTGKTKVDGITVTRRMERPNGWITVRQGNKWGAIINAPTLLPSGTDNSSTIREFQTICAAYGLPVGDMRSPGMVANLILAADVGRRAFPSEKHLSMHLQSFRGARFEGVNFGQLEGFDYDISSAYPWAISNLIDIGDCDWHLANNEQYIHSAAYGAALCTIVINPAAGRTAIALRVGQQSLYYPQGRFTGWLNLPEVQLLQKHPELGRIEKIHQGSWGVPNGETKPFQDTMRFLYELRREHPRFAAFTKAVMVSTYGKLVSKYTQGRNVVANYSWNPMYAAHVTSSIRCRTLADGLEKGVLGEQADGLITKEPIEESEGIGSWGLQGKGPMFQMTDMWANAAWKNLRIPFMQYAYMTPPDNDEIFFPLSYRLTLPHVQSMGLPGTSIGGMHEVWIPMRIGSGTRIPTDVMTVGSLLEGEVTTRPPDLMDVADLYMERQTYSELAKAAFASA